MLFYIALAAVLGIVIFGTAAERSRSYNVEINRIYNSVSAGQLADTLSLRESNAPEEILIDGCEYVERVLWLPVAAFSQEFSEAFFEDDNRLGGIVRPVYSRGMCTGFLRFEYRIPAFDADRIFWWVEIGMFIFALFIVGMLIFLKVRLIRPFMHLSSLPDELAGGHFKGIIREEKNKYMSGFLRSIGRMKDSLDISRKRQMELEKEKKKLLLSLSHDIKTPLNTIRLYGKALEEDLYKDEEKRLHAMHQISIKAEEIERYVEEIMKNSREGILDIQVREGEFYLRDLMDRVLDTYGDRCRIRLVELMVDKYENRLLKGDIDRALEVFENIFENAFKYGDGRQIRISFYEEDYCQLIRIFNTGATVSDTDFNHIFESFFRAANSGGMQGNGLGLYICREIMRKMDGEIFAEKSPEGMAFVVVFR